MKTQEKREMDMQALAQVSGGTDTTQDNSNNSGAQQNSQGGGSNYNDIIQNNYIANNSGSVQIGSPIVIKNGDIKEERSA